MAEWEAEEQKRVKAALNEAVNISEQKLQARQAHFDDSGDDSAEESVEGDFNSNGDSESDDDDMCGEVFFKLIYTLTGAL